MSEAITLGEAMSRRRFKKATSSRRYVPGQHKAVILGKEDMVLSYADIDGGLIILPVEWSEADDEWVHRGFLVRCTFDQMEVRFKPKGGGLNGAQTDAIKAALKKGKG